MKQLMIAVACLVALTNCDSNYNRNYNSGYSNGGQVVVAEPNVVVTSEATNLGDNLDLQALGELVKSSPDAKTIEAKLNADGSINNLDLDSDGNVDYITVTEYGTGTDRGFSFTVQLKNGEKQEVATVALQKGANNVAMNIQGNQQIYGQNAYYQSNYSLSDLMIMSYLFRPHPLFYSPYGYGHYPIGYHSYHNMPMSSYRSRVSTTTRTSTITRTTTRPSTSVKSPNASMNSKSVNTHAQSMASPTRSQKSFTKTSANNSRPVTSGFGNKRNTSNSGSSYSSPRRSSSSSFGSSSRSSSFGSSSRSGGRRR